MSQFNEAYYIQSKLAQLAAEGLMDSEGKQFTEDSLRAAIKGSGLTLEEHYNLYHTREHTSANPYFNTMEYLEAKAKQLNSIHKNGKSDWTAADVEDILTSVGMTAEQHYKMFGCKETDANGKLINPSNAFDANAYAEAKLAQLVLQDPDTYDGWTAMAVNQTIVDSGMTLVEHYEKYGKSESSLSGINLLQTVPVVERVADDTLRDAMDENVPSNYNKPQPLVDITSSNATAVPKPFDIGSDLAIKPDSPVPTPFDPDYLPVPDGGLTDTNTNPIVLVTSEVMGKTGEIVGTFMQYGMTFVRERGGVEIQTVRRVDDDGTVTDEIIQTTTENGITGETKVETPLVTAEDGSSSFSLVKNEWSYLEVSKDWYSLSVKNLNTNVAIKADDVDLDNGGNILTFAKLGVPLFSSPATVRSLDLNDPSATVFLMGSKGVQLDIANANENLNVVLTGNADDSLTIGTASGAEGSPKVTGFIEKGDEIDGSFRYDMGDNDILSFTNCGIRLEEDGYVVTGTQLGSAATLEGDISLMDGKLALKNKIDISGVTNDSGSMEFTLEKGAVRTDVEASEKGAAYLFETRNAGIELSENHGPKNADTLYLTKAVVDENHSIRMSPTISNFGNEDKIVLKGFEGINAAGKATLFQDGKAASGGLYYVVENEGDAKTTVDDIESLTTGMTSGARIALVDIGADATSANIFSIATISTANGDVPEVRLVAQITGADISGSDFSAIAF